MCVETRYSSVKPSKTIWTALSGKICSSVVVQGIPNVTMGLFLQPTLETLTRNPGIVVGVYMDID